MTYPEFLQNRAALLSDVAILQLDVDRLEQRGAAPADVRELRFRLRAVAQLVVQQVAEALPATEESSH